MAQPAQKYSPHEEHKPARATPLSLRERLSIIETILPTLATKEYLAQVEGRIMAEIAKLRGDVFGETEKLRGDVFGEIEKLRGDVFGAIEKLRGEMRGEIGEVRGEISEVRGEIKELRAEMRHTRIIMYAVLLAIISQIIRSFLG